MATELLPQILASTSYLPSIFVPIVGWVLPAVGIAFLFLYIEREDIA
jgi:photosystem I subunit VIII